MVEDLEKELADGGDPQQVEARQWCNASFRAVQVTVITHTKRVSVQNGNGRHAFTTPCDLCWDEPMDDEMGKCKAALKLPKGRWNSEGYMLSKCTEYREKGAVDG